MTDTYVAPAKINLHLAITDVRDDGLHVLDTSFVYVDVWDTLHIEPSATLKVTCSDTSLDGENNLVYQVLSAFKQRYKVKSGLSVFIDKKIPAQAGLGGGSSDAATALMVANKEWGIGLSKEELVEFSAPFGADIPCFVFAQASYATGIGEKLIPYQHEISTQFIVVAWPGTGVSTALAFKHYDGNKIHALTEEKTAATVRARSGETAFDLGYNDLEKSAVSLCFPLKEMLSEMRKKSDRAWMSGSGSACVAICNSPEQAYNLVKYLQENKLATWMHVGHFVREHPIKNIGA